MAITYTYSNCQISHYTLKKVDGSCKRDKEHTILVGVFCKQCPFYEGIKENYVICSSDFHKEDDEGAKEIRWEINENLREQALTAYYD